MKNNFVRFTLKIMENNNKAKLQEKFKNIKTK